MNVDGLSIMYVEDYNKGNHIFKPGLINSWYEYLPDRLKEDHHRALEVIKDYLYFKEQNGWVFVNEKLNLVDQFWDGLASKNLTSKDIYDLVSDHLLFVSRDSKANAKFGDILIEIGDLLDIRHKGTYLVGYTEDDQPIFREAKLAKLILEVNKEHQLLVSGHKPSPKRTIALAKKIEAIGATIDNYTETVGEYETFEFNTCTLFSKYLVGDDVNFLPKDIACIREIYVFDDKPNPAVMDKRRKALVEVFNEGTVFYEDFILVSNDEKTPWVLNTKFLNNPRYLACKWNFIPNSLPNRNDELMGIFDTETMEFILPRFSWNVNPSPQAEEYFVTMESIILEFLFFHFVRGRMVGFKRISEGTGMKIMNLFKK